MVSLRGVCATVASTYSEFEVLFSYTDSVNDITVPAHKAGGGVQSPVSRMSLLDATGAVSPPIA